MRRKATAVGATGAGGNRRNVRRRAEASAPRRGGAWTAWTDGDDLRRRGRGWLGEVLVCGPCVGRVWAVRGPCVASACKCRLAVAIAHARQAPAAEEPSRGRRRGRLRRSRSAATQRRSRRADGRGRRPRSDASERSERASEPLTSGNGNGIDEPTMPLPAGMAGGGEWPRRQHMTPMPSARDPDALTVGKPRRQHVTPMPSARDPDAVST